MGLKEKFFPYVLAAMMFITSCATPKISEDKRKGPTKKTDLEKVLNESSSKTAEVKSLNYEGMPGVGKVDRYEVEDSKYNLVHIRQVHRHPHGSRDESEEFLELVEGIQGDIYDLLKTVDKKGLDLVYFEGIGKENSLERNRELMRAHIAKKGPKYFGGTRLGLEGKFALGSSEFYKTRIKLFELEEKRLKITSEFYDLMNESIKRSKLFDEGKISSKEVLEMEREANQKSEALGEEIISLGKDEEKIRLDVREDDALEILSKDEIPKIKYLVYGGAHKFGDNVRKWNRKHPKKKFSLTVITPKTYHEYEKNKEAEKNKDK